MQAIDFVGKRAAPVRKRLFAARVACIDPRDENGSDKAYSDLTLGLVSPVGFMAV
jgi:hypothetical protein